MINIEKVVVSLRFMTVNSYIISDSESSDAVVIDPSAGYAQITKRLKELGKKCCAVLLTHGHYDHIIDTKLFQDDGAKVYAHKNTAEKLLDNKLSMSVNFNHKIPEVTADVIIKDNDELVFNSIKIKVLETPGHCSDSCCFILDNVIFSGDTLFYGTYGRVDFNDSNPSDMIKSLKRLFDLEGDYKVYPGHERDTTLQFERKNNPINYEF